MNAVKNVAYAFEFTQPLSQDVVKKIIEFYKKNNLLQKELPRLQPIESMTFQMEGAGINSFMPSAKTLAGVTFDRLKSNGEPEWSISFRPDAFVIICGRYESWTKTFSKACEYIEKFSEVLDGVFINIVGLEFNDEFIIADMQNPEWISEVFNKSTKYLTSDIFNRKGAWHIHSGHWSDAYYDNSVTHSLLNSFIDCLEDDQNSRQSMQIKHLQKCFLKEPSALKNLYISESVKNIYKKAHGVNYSFIADILDENMKRRIEMEPKE